MFSEKYKKFVFDQYLAETGNEATAREKTRQHFDRQAERRLDELIQSRGFGVAVSIYAEERNVSRGTAWTHAIDLYPAAHREWVDNQHGGR